MHFAVLHHLNWPERADHFDLLLQYMDGLPDAYGLATFTSESAAFLNGIFPTPMNRNPDHRLHYLNYEGPIPGGRGEVRCVEKGKILWLTAVDWQQTVSFQLESAKLNGPFQLQPMGNALCLLKKLAGGSGGDHANTRA